MDEAKYNKQIGRIKRMVFKNDGEVYGFIEGNSSTNGKDYYFGINESGTKKLNLPVAVNAIKYANIYTTIQNVKKVPRLKANDPFYKKGKEVFVTVSRSATAFIAPFKGMIVVD